MPETSPTKFTSQPPKGKAVTCPHGRSIVIFLRTVTGRHSERPATPATISEFIRVDIIAREKATSTHALPRERGENKIVNFSCGQLKEHQELN